MAYYLELDGIKGKSKEQKGAIDLLSYQFGDLYSGHVGGAGLHSVRSVTVTMSSAQYVPEFWNFSLDGRLIRKGVLTMKHGKDTYEWDFVELYVANVFFGSEVSVTLDFRKASAT